HQAGRATLWSVLGGLFGRRLRDRRAEREGMHVDASNQASPSGGPEVLLRTASLTRLHRKGARQVRALLDADLTIRKGEYVAITGPSGSGKSTLLSLLGLLDRPTSGSYRLGGHDAASLSDRAASEIRNEVIGFVFQGFHLIPHLSAWRNVALPLAYARGK